MADEEEIAIHDQLSLQILLSNRILKAAKEAESSKPQCADLSILLTHLIDLLVSFSRLAGAASYNRPIRRVALDLSNTLPRAYALTRRCTRIRTSARRVIRSMFAASTSADLEKVSARVKASVADLKWLHTVYDFGSGNSFNISLPPMACNDPILAWVWSYIAVLHMGSMIERIDAAQELAAIALINDRNKKIILEEYGAGPLLKLLKEGVTPEAQVSAATALYNLGNSRERVRLIASESNGVAVVVKLLFEMPPVSVLVALVNLIWRMADLDDVVKEEFGRQNVVRPLVMLLGMDVVLDEASSVKKVEPKRTTSLHSAVLMNRHVASSVSLGSNVYGNSKSLNYGSKWEKEMDSPELKLKLKESCAMALWKLVKGSLLNGQKIMETKGLLVLAKIVEKEKGELQIACLMTVMELAAVAEYNNDFRRTAFKPNSPVPKAIIDQLLRVINEDDVSPSLLIPAIRAIGCLARTFPAREARIIEPLVALLENENGDVVREVAMALGKFVRPDNFNCLEHSRAVVEFNGVAKLVALLRENVGSQFHVLLLLCYLAIHVGDSAAFEEARALSVLEGEARHTLSLYPDLCDLFAKARQHLMVFHSGPLVIR